MAINDHLVTRSAELLSVQISMAAVAVLAVALRLISRFLVLKNPGWDDYIIALGTASTTSRLSVVLSLTSIQLLGLTTTVLTLAGLPYGAARHMADIVSMKDLECILKVFSIW